jgi:hypothetical protein
MRVRRSFNHNAETQKRLKKIAFDTSYGAGAYFDKHKQRYVRYSAIPGYAKKFCKRATRRKMHKDGYISKKQYDGRN